MGGDEVAAPAEPGYREPAAEQRAYREPAGYDDPSPRQPAFRETDEDLRVKRQPFFHLIGGEAAESFAPRVFGA